MSLAEKFQITVAPKAAPPDKWVSADSQRPESNLPFGHDRFNVMPVGYDATNSRDNFVNGFGGDTDVSGDVQPKSLTAGYHRLDMKATDDQYSGENVDLFYGDATDELGNTGFTERNNYLDRI